MKETAKQLGVKATVLIHPVRLAATGNPHGPSLYHLLEVLGKEKVLDRLTIPENFILRIGIFIRDVHGLPEIEYKPSKSKALELFQKIRRIAIEREVERLLQEDREGAFSLLLACIDFSSFRGTPISLPDIAAAKIEDTEWNRDGVTNVSITWFLMNAINAVK